MGLSSAMWTGVSGLNAHSQKMSVIGNNISNVNTYGFKGSTMHFEDFISQDVNTSAGVGQVGRGVGIAAIYADFSQGGYETTNEATDLAIGGRGFFKVSPKGDDTSYYTRAGNFRFDNDGFLVDPHGYPLQGWKIDQSSHSALAHGGTTGAAAMKSSIRGSGAPTDIRVENFTSQPKATEALSVIANLDGSEGGNHTTDGTDPYFAMFKNWNGSATPPLGDKQYAYQTTMKIYDEGGTAHDMTVYFDQAPEVTSTGDRVWEYMVTVPPGSDGRVDTSGDKIADTKAAGVMMVGTLTFDSSGQLKNQSAFTLKSGDYDPSAADGDAANPQTLTNWEAAKFNTDGQPVFTANFSGKADASFPGDTDAHNIAVNFGLSNANPSGGWATGGAATAGAVGTAAGQLPEFNSTTVEAKACTSFAGSSSTQYQAQDGYTFGYLQNVTVDRDGIMSGRYSNGVTLELYQVTIYDFQNKWGLHREGGNLFTETRESGAASAGPANANGFGNVNANSLEMSNVDLSKEFVNMISTERGFQANSKVITSTDTMLQTVIAMKK
ncbi:flagellar hook protein FlgE [Desulfobaculum bizertense]|uniref:flagellar hook protein FlgE n=1 Tax=Desulfobaculum bizertense TaxID=376490 RepID=UPI001F455045|nr:flagellar hook protein FlgE [Desulfobaculum bizertense]UIJ36968.1 flagellar hook protein FlgE [Desulfobaculum bizertense]